MQFKPYEFSDRVHFAFTDDRYKGFFVVSIFRPDPTFADVLYPAYEVWLRHASYGVSEMLFGLACSDFGSFDDAVKWILPMMDSFTAAYAVKYLDDDDIL